jgi:hypothetical protein
MLIQGRPSKVDLDNIKVYPYPYFRVDPFSLQAASKPLAPASVTLG